MVTERAETLLPAIRFPEPQQNQASLANLPFTNWSGRLQAWMMTSTLSETREHSHIY